MTKVNGKILRPARTVDGQTISREKIDKRLRQIVEENVQPYYGDWNGDPETAPLFVQVLFGAFMIYPLLLSKLKPDFPTFVGAIRAKSYKENGVRSEVKIRHPIFDCSLKGKRVLIIDDIVESGQTLSALKSWFLRRHAADVKTFALLDKPSKRTFDIEVDWVGFNLQPNQWVVGMGLDDNNLFRHFNNVVVATDPSPKGPPKGKAK